MSDKKLSEFAAEFHKKQDDKEYSPRMIDWMCTYHIAVIDEKKLWPLLEKALPYKVIINDHYTYNKLGKWIDKNCTGMWTHSTVLYRFELEEDAIAFKLRWL